MHYIFKALQEDEDENMEEGARIATELLGKDKEHLYPKIFQLVMADAAFTDGRSMISSPGQSPGSAIVLPPALASSAALAKILTLKFFM